MFVWTLKTFSPENIFKKQPNSENKKKKSFSTFSFPTTENKNGENSVVFL